MDDTVLASLTIFQSLGPESRAELAASMHQQNVPKGTTLFRIGDPATELYLLASGKVKLTKPSQAPVRRRRGYQPAKESLLWLIGPGEMFGELSIFDPGRRSTSAVAMTDCVALSVAATTLVEIMERHHDLTLVMLRQLASRLRRANGTTSGLVLTDVSARVAALLLSLAERFGVKAERGTAIHHDLTQTEMAQMVGASRETVNKVLTDFEERRWIEVQPGSIIIRDKGRLQARAV